MCTLKSSRDCEEIRCQNDVMFCVNVKSIQSCTNRRKDRLLALTTNEGMP